jgi:hypothetical protein
VSRPETPPGALGRVSPGHQYIGASAGARPDATAEAPDQPSDPTAEATRLSHEEARTLKQLAQQAFGYREGERRLRADLGFEVDERLTLRHLAAHTTPAQYARLRAEYEAVVQQVQALDVPG